MSNTKPGTGTSWTTVVARGLKTKVPAPLRKIGKDGQSDVFSTRILFEDPEIAAYNRSLQVTSIIHSALSPKAVVFDIPSSLFKHRTDAYKLIVDQLGPVVGGFNPISLRGTRPSGNLIIATEFRDTSTTAKAISTGVTVDNMQFKAIPYKENATSSDSLIRVNLTLHRLEEDDILLPNLLSSLSNYGKVCQIKKLLCRNFFEGELSVLLDRAEPEIDNPRYQKLTRVLYLDAWDVFAPASFKGADPICYYCRKTGHVKKDCPALKDLTCFGCGKSGHIKRRCRSSSINIEKEDVPSTATTTFEEDLDSYQSLQAETSISQQSQANDPVEVEGEVLMTDTPEDARFDVISEDEILEVLKENEVLKEDQTEENMDLSSEEEYASTLEGSKASKYAPVDIRTTMDIDTPRRTTRTRKASSKKLDNDNSLVEKFSSSPVSTQTQSSSRKGHE
jgi:hypothetical protein